MKAFITIILLSLSISAMTYEPPAEGVSEFYRFENSQLDNIEFSYEFKHDRESVMVIKVKDNSTGKQVAVGQVLRFSNPEWIAKRSFEKGGFLGLGEGVLDKIEKAKKDGKDILLLTTNNPKKADKVHYSLEISVVDGVKKVTNKKVTNEDRFYNAGLTAAEAVVVSPAAAKLIKASSR